MNLLIPPFAENKNYRQLHPTQEGERRWRFVTTSPNWLYIEGIVPKGHIITFHDKHGKEWMRWTDQGMRLASAYAWNGATPKIWIWPFGWIGTIDFQSTIQATLWHDALYQFAACEHFTLHRSDCDQIFKRIIHHNGSPRIAAIYHAAVVKFGSWNHKNSKEYSTLITA